MTVIRISSPIGGVDNGAEDDIGIHPGFLDDDLVGFLHLVEREARAPADVDQQRFRAGDRDVLESGLATARRAASLARLSPEAMPVPMSALPRSHHHLTHVGEVRLTRHGTMMRSLYPLVAWSSTWSASLNASVSGVPRSTTDRSRSFGW
jgi:hypothetical protein